ncbi:MAG: CPBP family intramembrane metalloprotease [Oscillospiraceae bacterium]|nr:CPBP family intramembrane metalloprotease [Oscillospiraceae bacterium]
MNINIQKNTKTLRNEEKTDLTEDFDYSGQSEEYIRIYKQWRKNPDNPYTYNYIKNKHEITFTDNEGFVNNSPEKKEYEVLGKILYAFGIVLIIYLFTEYVISKFLVEVLDYLGLNIHNSFMNYSMYGGKTEVMIVMITITLLKFCIPILILKKAFKMPFKASCPYKLQNPKDLFLCISLSLLVSVLTSISRAYSNTTRDFFSFFHENNDEIFFMNQSELIIYMFFDIIIVSVITEILFRGAIFQALRQFGDFYAVIISALFSAFMTHNIASFPASFAVSVISGISILRSGTMFTAFSVAITNKIYLFMLSIIELSYSNMWFKRSTFMSLCFLISIIISSVIWNTTDKKTVLKKNFYTFLSTKQKIMTVFNSIPSLTVIFLCIIIMISDILI